MAYRVVEILPSWNEPRSTRQFSSAYEAVDFMTDAWFRGDERARCFHLIDEDDHVVLSPDDLIGPCTATWGRV